MGVSASFGSGDVVLIREGICFNPDPVAMEPDRYVHVISPGYPETWMEGMEVYHNPRALYPLDPGALPGAVHHQLGDSGEVLTSSYGEFQPLSSLTSILVLGV
jgi:hypothetical protein